MTVLFAACDTPNNPGGGPPTGTTYTVSFIPNGGTPAPQPQTVNSGGKASEPPAMSKGADTLLGWYWTADFSGAPWNFAVDTVSGDITLYAKWLITYTVSFDAKGGSPAPAQQAVGEGGKVSEPAAMTKGTEALFGWFKEEAFTTPWNFAADTVSDNITLYAKWEEVDSIEKVNAWLAMQTANTETGPLDLTVKIGLGDMGTGSGWKQLLDALDGAGIYLNLNLAACTLTGTEFDPDNTDATGKAYITSIVLPDAATGIADGTYAVPTFAHFAKLKTAGGTGITDIGDYAFLNCAGLTGVSFPAAEAIGFSAFNGCAGLTGANFPAAETIGDNAFHNCAGLTSVSFPAAETIGDSAFNGCAGLSDVSFPAAQSIGVYAFVYCIGLNNISIPSTAELPNGNPFIYCSALTTITLLEGGGGSGALSLTEGGRALVNNNNTLVAYLNASGSIAMTGITRIGSLAFLGCTGLTDVSVPVVETIGQFAFEGCSGLTDADIPAAETISNATFYNCTGLTGVSIPAAETIDYSAFANTGTGALEITLGGTAPVLGHNIFDYISSPKTVTVKVPSGASGYDEAWKTAFKGGASNQSGEVNNNITLIIEEAAD